MIRTRGLEPVLRNRFLGDAKSMGQCKLYHVDLEGYEIPTKWRLLFKVIININNYGEVMTATSDIYASTG